MIKKGRGLAVSLYPTGFAGGGDLCQAIVRLNFDGSVQVYCGEGDIGQGAQTVAAMVTAEELGIPYDKIKVYNIDTDIAPYSDGAIASRGSFGESMAIGKAAREARALLLDAAGVKLGVKPDTLTISDGMICSQEDPGIKISIKDAASDGYFKQGRQLIGTGSYMGDICVPNFDTGVCPVKPFRAIAWAACLADVEVETDTGVVTVKKVCSVYDAGCIINSGLAKGQIEGGSVMGMGAAIMEELYPYYPALDWTARSFSDYCIPVASDMPEMVTDILECPSTDNTYGIKGIGEMTPNVVCPAIVNAVYDAIGIRFNTIPLSPARVLAALSRHSDK